MLESIRGGARDRRRLPDAALGDGLLRVAAAQHLGLGPLGTDRRAVNNIQLQQDITTTSTSPTVAGGIRDAGRRVQEQTLTGIQEAVIVFTGGPR